MAKKLIAEDKVLRGRKGEKGVEYDEEWNEKGKEDKEKEGNVKDQGREKLEEVEDYVKRERKQDW
jgi:hypothetical protein